MFEQYEDIEHPPAPPSRGWMIAKILLRVLSIVTAVAIIGICILVSLAFREPAEKYHFAWQIAIGSSVEIAPPTIIVVADIIEFIVMCARRGRGIHPGFNVALNLIFWIVSICMAAFTDNGASALLAINSERNGPNTAHPIDEDDITLFRTFGRTYRIVAALFGVMIIFRFILFVRACVETHKYRDEAKQVVILSHTPYYAPQEPQIPLNTYSHVPSAPSPYQQPPPQYYEHAKSPTQPSYPSSPQQNHAPPSPLSQYQFSKAQNF